MTTYIKNIVPSKKSMLSLDNDIHINLNLINDKRELLNNQIFNVLDISNQFNKERQECGIYRIIINTDLISPVLSLKNNFSKISDLFDYKTAFDNPDDFIEFNDLFDVYVCVPDKFYKTNINNQYRLGLKVISKISNTDIVKNGFSSNIYGDQLYQIIFHDDIDISDKFIFDNDNQFRLPITELFIFYKPKQYNRLTFNNQYLDINGNITTIDTDTIYGGLYNIDFNFFDITLIEDPETTLTATLEETRFIYLTNNIIPVKIKDYSIDFENGNILTTDNIPFYAYLENDESNEFNKNRQEVLSITDTNIFSGSTRLLMTDPINLPPRKLIFNTKTNFYEYYLNNELLDKSYFIFKLNNILLEEGIDYLFSDSDKTKIILRFKPMLGDNFDINYQIGLNYIWKDIFDIGFIDPETNSGVDYPFVNGKHYLFDNQKIIVRPDFNDIITKNFYCKFIFNQETVNQNIDPNNLQNNC